MAGWRGALCVLALWSPMVGCNDVGGGKPANMHHLTRTSRGGEGDASCARDEPEDLFAWVEHHGGFVSPRLELSTGPDPASRLRGIYATGDFEEGDVVAEIPWELVVANDASRDPECRLVRNLREEMRLGRCSRVWPYLKIMQESVIDVPNTWLPKDLLLLESVIPGNWQRHSQWHYDSCNGDLRDPLAVRAMLLFVTRSSIDCMAPVYDMFNHRNGRWTNVDVAFEAPTRILMTALRDIPRGDQMYITFGDGAARMLRDYGFVEQTPQIWSFSAEAMVWEFTLENDVGDVTFVPNVTQKYVQFMRNARDFRKTLKWPVGVNSSRSRHAVMAFTYIKTFRHALTLAMQAASVASNTVLLEVTNRHVARPVFLFWWDRLAKEEELVGTLWPRSRHLSYTHPGSAFTFRAGSHSSSELLQRYTVTSKVQQRVVVRTQKAALRSEL